jgi:hypothetical protein
MLSTVHLESYDLTSDCFPEGCEGLESRGLIRRLSLLQGK